MNTMSGVFCQLPYGLDPTLLLCQFTRKIVTFMFPNRVRDQSVSTYKE